MNKLATFTIMAAALLGSQVANAHHVPAPSGTLNGIAAVSKGINLTCALKITFLAGGKANVELNPGDPNCAALIFNNAPYTYTYNSTTHAVTFQNVDVTTISVGDCYGNISGTWDGTALTVNSTLPAKTAGAPCTVIGTAS